MHIGFANIYSWRPHLHQLVYLSRLAEEGGHQSAFLTCDSGVSECYSRLLRGRSRIRECGTCIAGGVRSFPVSNVTSVKRYPVSLDTAALDRLALSSSCTLTRTESDDEWNDPDVVAIRRRLHDAVGAAYESTLRWIERQKLDAIICFNGRIDMTAAILKACAHAGIPSLTHERPWFGDGIYCNPNENCLSLTALDAMVADFSDKPLTAAQAALAGKLLAMRFRQQNTLEWRVYNKDAVAATWPLSGDGPKVLVLPSSRNELAGQDDRLGEWKDNTLALDDFMQAFGIDRNQVVVRFHPNWGESIGRVDGSRPLRHYENWCAQRGIYHIPSSDKRSTYDLIDHADIVVVNGSSSGVEAGALGKTVYCLAPAMYEAAGFAHIFRNHAELHDPVRRRPIPQAEIVSKTMRFVYTHARRFPQFIDHVRAVKTTEYDFFEGADPARLTRMLQTGKVEPSDKDFAPDDSAEKRVVGALLARDWSRLVAFEEERPTLQPMRIRRRKSLDWLDKLRNTMARGDLS